MKNHDSILKQLQQNKMKELWDNKEDEAWADAQANKLSSN
jgi:hypothetical protein